MKIQASLDPVVLDTLTTRINESTPEYGTAYPFTFIINNEHGHLIAGCNGSVVYGAIYTDQLWVDPKHRQKGLALKLMNHVHDYGREQGCLQATVCTMSFQPARGLYEKIGYVCDFEQPGYTQGSSCIFLRKTL